MAAVDITAQDVRALFDYNPEIGLLIFKSGLHWRIKPGTSPQGRMPSGYLRVSVKREMLLVHRVIWLWVHGEWPKGTIDHINGIKDDNRLCNLRDVPEIVNLENKRRAQRTSKTGVLGVSPNHGRFVACIQVRGVFHYLGRYKTVEEASAVYLDHKRRLHEGCTI